MTGNGKWKLTSLSSKSPLYSSARKCVILAPVVQRADKSYPADKSLSSG